MATWVPSSEIAMAEILFALVSIVAISFPPDDSITRMIPSAPANANTLLASLAAQDT
jgi:hypothetical protein